MSTSGTRNFGLLYLDPSQSQPEVKFNANMDSIDELLADQNSITVKQVGDSPAGDAFHVRELHIMGATVEAQTDGVALLTFSGGGGGGGGSSLTVTDGTTTVAAATELLIGSGLTLSNPSGTIAEIVASGASLPLTTKGDLLVYDTAPDRLAVGADGDVLVASSSHAPGVVWTALALPSVFGNSSTYVGPLGGSAMASGDRVTLTVSIVGAAIGMVAIANPESDPGAGFVWTARVSASNTVEVALTCVAAGTPTTGYYVCRVIG